MKMRKTILSMSLAFIMCITTFVGGGVFASEIDNSDLNENAEKTIDREITKESNESEGEEETTKDDKTLSFTNRANGIGIGITVPSIFQTYTDPVSGLTPPELNVELALSISQPDIEGAYIELPYEGFMPSCGDSVYENFEINQDIFKLVTPSTPALNSIVESYTDDITNHKLIIKLKKTSITVETLNLKFEYNMVYDAKIQSEQTIWKDVEATVKASDESTISKSNTETVKAETFVGDMTPRITSANKNITADTAGATIVFLNQGRNKALLDNNYEHYYYVDVPSGHDFSPKGFFGDSTKVVLENIGGYKRYKVKFDDSMPSFPVAWSERAGGYYGIDTTFSGFNSLSIGQSVDMKVGIVFKKINDKVKTHESIITFDKVALDRWNFSPSIRHSVGSNELPSVINTFDSNSIGGNIYTAGGYEYNNSTTTKNTGSNDVKNLRITLYQQSNASEKLNFEDITVLGMQESSSVPLTKYKMKFEIKNAINLNTRNVETGLYSGSRVMNLPTLGSNEYIDKAILIPMGTSGNDEGHLSSKNGLTIVYRAKNWNTAFWPDGTAISQSKVYKVTMGLTTSYLDEGDITNPVTKQVTGNSCVHSYASSKSVNAYAYMVSSNSTSRIPGNIINYELQGYNGTSALGNEWKSPEITVAIPKILELQNSSLKADYMDAVNNQTHTDAVDIDLLNSDENYNYYRFTTSKSAYKNNNDVSFKIPLKFKLVEGTAQGTYTIPTLTVGGNNFLQVIKDTNNLSDGSKFGYDNLTSNYTAINSGHTATTVATLTKLNGTTWARGASSDAWTSSTYFGVGKNTIPQMKAEIKNAGNTVFTNAKLYNILPYDGDARGSSGNVEFAGLSGSGTVYYTTKEVSSLPGYDGLNLQTWTSSTLIDNGFSTSIPSDLSKVTAIYIDYVDLGVNPLESLDAIINVKVPNANNLLAVNQFAYSAKEKETNTQLNAKSDAVTFSTEVGQVTYTEDKPTVTEGVVTNMPISPTQVVLLDGTKKGSIILSPTVPILNGYSFGGWRDNDNNRTYNPGDIIYFDKGTNPNTEIELKAIWTAKTYTIAFDANTGAGTMADQSYTYDMEQSLSSNAFSKDGYTFMGWNTKNDGLGINYANNASIKNLATTGTVTLYAKWKLAEYTINYQLDGGKNHPDNPVNYAYGAGVTAFKDATKDGHTFQGWFDGNDNQVTNIGITDMEDKTLYAKWEANTYNISYELGGGTNHANNPTEYTAGIGVKKLNDPTKEGYKFFGWYVEPLTRSASVKITSISETDFGDKVLFAKWQKDEPEKVIGKEKPPINKTKTKTPTAKINESKGAKTVKTGVNNASSIMLILIGLLASGGYLIFRKREQ